MIDSHCHLAAPQFAQDFEEVIARAVAAGVSPLITIADDLKEADMCRSIAEKYEHIFYTVGVHPHHASQFDGVRDLAVMREHAKHPKCMAIGEIGLDYHYMNSSKGDQRLAFSDQLSLAKELMLSAVVHTREAIEDTWNIIDELRPQNIVLHCCTEKWDDVKRFVDRGYLLSFTGIATYPKSTDIRETMKQCPLKQMMIETDAPFLSPNAKRGKRNEPAFVTEVAACIAQVKGITVAEVDAATTANAVAFYGICS